MTKHANNDFMTKLPGGAIIMWSGTLVDLKKIGDWVLCDGKNNTPNLINRFIVGAGDEYSVGIKGGIKNVKLTEDHLPTHTHDIDVSNNVELMSGLTLVKKRKRGGKAKKDDLYLPMGDQKNYPLIDNLSIEHTGKGAAFDNRPPYFPLYYIMKIK
ncbi:hypothetical protein KORDIASMS9_03758 [Kordia sp. SMS9]|uniref:hypothetical protein n=1 Tax=Kordia sp. SMS9 TaxID=2282170 RepID=UPI000E0DBB12|nr:hypothetical protein [Kordia sp. SMS9]AXG71501.1 hypothetical protein KORDIASMS9_03758 [Kordia sp. SMS9]